jgi:hypothetical protein
MFFVPRLGGSFQVTGVNPTSGLTYYQTKIATKEVNSTGISESISITGNYQNFVLPALFW